MAVAVKKSPPNQGDAKSEPQPEMPSLKPTPAGHPVAEEPKPEQPTLKPVPKKEPPKAEDEKDGVKLKPVQKVPFILLFLKLHAILVGLRKEIIFFVEKFYILALKVYYL